MKRALDSQSSPVFAAVAAGLMIFLLVVGEDLLGWQSEWVHGATAAVVLGALFAPRSSARPWTRRRSE